MKLEWKGKQKNLKVFPSEIRLKTVSAARQKKVDKLLKDLGEA